MSKSKGNFYTLRDLLNKGYDPLAIRYVLISFHYRSKMNFSLTRMDEAKGIIERLQTTVDRVLELMGDFSLTTPPPQPTGFAAKAFQGFCEGLADDLNIAKALAELFDFTREVNAVLDRGELDRPQLQDIFSFYFYVNSVLAVLRLEKQQEQVLDTDIERLIQERQNAKANKDFKKSDEIRDKLKELGIVLEDTKTGVKWKRKGD